MCIDYRIPYTGTWSFYAEGEQPYVLHLNEGTLWGFRSNERASINTDTSALMIGPTSNRPEYLRIDRPANVAVPPAVSIELGEMKKTLEEQRSLINFLIDTLDDRGLIRNG